MSLVYESTAGQIVLSDSVLETLATYRQLRRSSKEAGGQLFGTLSPRRLVVEMATKPNRDDRRHRFWFFPNRSREQQDINTQFIQGLHYVGDWHTHPEEAPEPSFDDLVKIGAIFRESQHSLPSFLLVIAGRKAAPEGLWVGTVDFDDVRQIFPRRPDY